MKQNDLYKLIIYIVIFVLAILIVVFERKDNKAVINTKTDSSEKITKEEFFVDIDNNYYSADIFFYTIDDAISLNYEKNGSVIIGSKKYHNEITNYIYYNNKYYDNNLKQLDNFNSFIYDQTFIKLETYKELFKLNYIARKEGNAQILSFYTKDIISLFNIINNDNNVYFSNDKIDLYIYYNNDKIDYLLLDISKIYNYLYNENKDFSILKISFDKSKKEDISEIIEMLN